jgi:hypothetical protein
MSRFGLLAAATLAALALAATMAASASALVLPQVEPQQATWTGASEGSVTLTSLNFLLPCQKATAEGTEETGTKDKSLGLFHIAFKECKNSQFRVQHERGHQRYDLIIRQMASRIRQIQQSRRWY